MTYRQNMNNKRFSFTKKKIEALPAHDPASPSREAEYSDAECTGLRLRVSKNGRRFFQHRYSFLGRKQCISLGEFPAVSIQDARLRVNEHKTLLARGKDPAVERGKVRDDLTFVYPPIRCWVGGNFFVLQVYMDLTANPSKLDLCHVFNFAYGLFVTSIK